MPSRAPSSGASVMSDGFTKDNPILIQMIGLCPVLFLTSQATTALAIGICTTAVLLFASLLAPLVRDLIPQNGRYFFGLLLVAGIVAILENVLQTYFQPLSESLSIFVPLIAVNCFIIGRLTTIGFRTSLGRSMGDALAMGLGFTGVAVLIGVVREALGRGTILGFPLSGGGAPWGVIPLLSFPVGGFLVLGILAAVFPWRDRAPGNGGHYR